MSRGSVVSMVTRLRARRKRNRVSILGEGSRCFSTPKLETGSGTSPLFYSLGTEGKAVAVWSWELTGTSAQGKNDGSCISIPPYAFIKQGVTRKYEANWNGSRQGDEIHMNVFLEFEAAYSGTSLQKFQKTLSCHQRHIRLHYLLSFYFYSKRTRCTSFWNLFILN
jgi:hypothetical protein